MDFYEDVGTLTSERAQLFRDTFMKNHADKSGGHSYELVYAALFQDLASVKNVCELGIYHGASLRAWRELFPNANIVGLDRDSNYFVNEERITSYYADQEKEETLTIPGNIKFDMFVDDASHNFEFTLKTFEKLNKFVNGYYVIEDIKDYDLDKWQKLNYPNSWLVDMSSLRPNLHDNHVLVIKL